MPFIGPGVRALLTYGLGLSLLLPLGTSAHAQYTEAPISMRQTGPVPVRKATSLVPEAPARPILTTIVQPSAFDQLEADLNAIISQSGAQVGLSLQELSGPRRQALTLNGDHAFYAASEYKLPLLMAEAQAVADGQVSAGDSLCYDASDSEDGWFTDYEPGACFSRAELATRAGRYSDNTAARILVRYMGGPYALNAYAHAAGMTRSTLWDPNITTATDLTSIWLTEAIGGLGGTAAQSWLYPILTRTAAESGIPAGLPSAATVVHKTGDMSGVQLDAADVGNGRVHYILAVCVAGLDEVAGWAVIQRISARIWRYEAGRPDYVAPPAAVAPVLKMRPGARH
ncbi:MAG: class A beta-lactamase-related serine hydrolase [Candidatus Dormibacteraeota bacterium]|nr:class A beta-lactamase-related serine hydrolase [Candidatus Dormibacteraeota bacterium]